MSIPNHAHELLRTIVRETESGAYFDVMVATNARANRIQGIDPWRRKLKLSVKAPPVKGKANARIIAYMATVLELSINNISIIKGQTSSNKRISVAHTHKDDVLKRLEGALV